MLPIAHGNTQTITSIQLHEIVNKARESMGENKVRSDAFMKRVKDELDGDLGFPQVMENPEGGRPRQYYDLTMQQAMLVGMRESKAVRRAVLAKLEAMQQPSAPAVPVTPMQKAVSDMEAWKAAAALFGVHESLALVEGVKHVAIAHDVDFKPLLLQSPVMDDIQPEQEMLEPTELGRVVGMTAREVNQRMASVGLQYRAKSGQWEPTQKASGHVIKHMWQASQGTKTGYNLKWRLSFVRKYLES